MMYVSGETGEPSVETTCIIEDIVKQQVLELLKNCTEQGYRRGARSITINDLIFQIRHDSAKVSRLRTFLSWKDVRKTAKDSDDKGGDAGDLVGGPDDPTGAGSVPEPGDAAGKKSMSKKAKVGLPWDPTSFYNQEVPERDDDEDEEEEMNHITLQRLRKADERTKAMTKDEYVTWSEYRQASFTYRKAKRFREWAAFGIVTDTKPSDDIVDILGFLTFEMVQTLTEAALRVKEVEELQQSRAKNNNNNNNKNNTTGTSTSDAAGGIGKSTTATTKDGTADGNGGKARVATLFSGPSSGKTPVEPRHVREAFQVLQQRPRKMRAMLNGSGLPYRTPLNLF